MSVRWVYGFQRVGTRDLSSAERDQILRAGRRGSRIKWTYGALAGLIFLLAMLGIAIAASGLTWGWIVLVMGTLVFLWVLSLASAAESYALLCRRAVSVGTVDRFEKIEATDAVRRRYAFSDNDEDGSRPNPFWKDEQKFIERLAKEAGKTVTCFETPASDDVAITAGDCLVRHVIDADSVMVEDRKV